MKVWSCVKTIRKLYFTRTIKIYEKEQNYDYNLFFKKELDEKKENEDFYFHKQEEEVKNEPEKKLPKKFSKKYGTLSSNIYQKINLMKNQSEKMKKLNTFSLQKISKEYFRLTPRKNYSITNIEKMIRNDNNKNNTSKNTMNTISTQSSFNYHNKNNNFRTISASRKRLVKFKPKEKNHVYRILNQNNRNKKYVTIIDTNGMIKRNNNLNKLSALKRNKTSEKLKNYVDLDVEALYKYNNKNIINLDRFNNSFRVQMNNTCYKFIPRNHLKKLNELQRDNPLVRKSMETIKGKIASKVKDFTNKKLMVKKFLKTKENFKKDEKIRILSARKMTFFPDKIPFNIKFPTGQYIFPFGFKTRALYEHNVHSLESERRKQKLIKIEKKKEPEKNIKINDILMDKALKKLNNCLNVKNIAKYISEMKKETSKDKREMTISQLNKYFPLLREANSYIQKFDINKSGEKYKFKEKTKGYLEVDDDVEIEKNIVGIEDKIKKL